MVYFDTDVLIHTIIDQDSQKREVALNVLESHYNSKTLAISLLSIQEIAFVLGKMKVKNAIIIEKLKFFMALNPLQLNIQHYERAIFFAKLMGFKNYNDCLHLALAETHCKELYTFNLNDFEKIKNHTTLKINILP